jgi:transglutaminase/protease-like cytokinesis protein 3
LLNLANFFTYISLENFKRFSKKRRLFSIVDITYKDTLLNVKFSRDNSFLASLEVLFLNGNSLIFLYSIDDVS